MIINLFNVKYSPNLGDGVIAECLEAEIRRCIPNAVVRSIDLAGRTTWLPPQNSRFRAAALSTLRRLPRWASNYVVKLALGQKLRRSLQPLWSKQLAEASFVIFGGGQLFQDPDLNFPLKLAAANEACRSQNLKKAIYSVGVSRCHSPRGRNLLRGLLDDPDTIHIGVRDENSINNLSALSNRTGVLTPDPGLLASRFWPSESVKARANLTIGLGITHPSVLMHHAERSSQFSDYVSLYQQTIQSLLSSGFDVVCFSNGAGEDERLLREILLESQPPKKWDGRVQLAPRAAHPRELARLISQFDAVIAHRLHTNILAYSYRVPHIGLAWDPKLQAFFDSVDRDKFHITLDDPNSRSIASRVIEALEAGISTQIHSRTLDLSADSIAKLAAKIVEASKLKVKPRYYQREKVTKPDYCHNQHQLMPVQFSDSSDLTDPTGRYR